MYEAFADATKAITWAISSGVARRLIGTVETSAALFSAVLVKRVSIPVSVVPGATTFTANSGPCNFQCCGFCHSFHSVFAAYINGCSGGTDASIGRGDIDDAPASLGKHYA